MSTLESLSPIGRSVNLARAIERDQEGVEAYAQACEILKNRASFVDHQVRLDVLNDENNEMNFTVIVEQLLRTQAVSFDGHYVQLRDFYNDSDDTKRIPLHLGAILVIGSEIDKDGLIKDGQVLVRFHDGQIIFEHDADNKPRAIEQLKALLLEMETSLENVSGLAIDTLQKSPTDTGRRRVIRRDFVGEEAIKAGKAEHKWLQSGYSLEELEAPYQAK